jgi:hypothetical protein
MSTQTVLPVARKGVDWRRAEFVLTLCGFIGLLTLPVQIGTLYSGLPAHPLFIHVPVVLIPLSVLGALACVVKPVWFDRYGILLAATSIVAMSSVFPTMHAGSALEASLNLQGPTAELIRRHSHAANILAIAFVAFTAILILTFAAHRISGGRPTGLGVADGVLSARASYLTLRLLLVLLAVGCAYMVFKVGDLGAKAVWQGRLQQHGGPGPGGFARPPT